ncbi:MAG: PAS domain-containing protein [Pseudomonadota bacterium]
MFAVARQTPEDQFRFICLNQEFQNIGGKKTTDLIGKSPFELLPDAAAQRVHDRYAACARTRSIIRYQDALTQEEGSVVWDTTLQCSNADQYGDVLLGTTVALGTEKKTEEPALADIAYFSTMADMQIENLISLFDTYRGRDLFTSQNEERIKNLSRLCRTVQSAVTDIRRVVDHAHLDDAARRSRDVEATRRGCSQTPLGSDTLKALFGNARPII